MNPTLLGVIGPGFLNQVPTLFGFLIGGIWGIFEGSWVGLG